MNSFNTFNKIFGSNKDMFEPKSRKAMPFPLDFIDRDIAEAFEILNRILVKINSSKLDPNNQSPAKKKRINSLKYKTSTCIKLLKQISSETDELWF